MTDERDVRDSSSADAAAAVMPSDTTSLGHPRALYIGGAGNVAATMSAGGTVTFAGVPAGTLLPIRVTKVLAATTASNIVALW